MTKTTNDWPVESQSPDYEGWSAKDILEDLVCRVFPNRIALVSSFGTESAVLLHLTAEIDRNVPVIFLDTGKLFPETLAYRDTLVQRLGLRDVRSVRPSAGALAMADADGQLWDRDTDRCCWHRKVEPLDEALSGFAAWITGRKRFQSGVRGMLPHIERDEDGRIKANPLAHWDAQRLQGYLREHDLPRHPLWDRGFRSIGCAPCTVPTASHDDARSGRWAGRDKTECGIHLARGRNVTQNRIAGGAQDG